MNTKEIAEMIKKMSPQEREELSKELETIEKKRVFARWRPREGERYYMIDGDRDVPEMSWDNYVFDIYQYDAGNCYQTKELAEQARDSKKAKDKLLEEIREYMDEIGCEEPVWDGCTKNTWLFCYNHGVDDYRWIFEPTANKTFSKIPTFKYDEAKCNLILNKFKDRLDILLEDV